MPVRPYVLVGAQVLAAVRRALEGALDGWCADWGVARPDTSLACVRAWDGALDAVPAAHWRQLRRSGDAALWLAWPAELAAAIQRVLFAPDRSHAPIGVAQIAPAGAEAALLGLLEHLSVGALLGTVQATEALAAPAEASHYGSGAVLVTISIGCYHCHCVLDDGAVRALAEQARLRGAIQAGALPALAPVSYQQALGQVAVRLPVEIGSAVVGLGSLMSLGIGDVIRLDAVADRPLSVRGPAGVVLFDGYLGLAEQSVALEVVRHVK